MSNSQTDATQASSEVGVARERTKQVEAAAWTAGLSALFITGTLAAEPTWPVAAGTAALSAMVGTVCRVIIRGPGKS